MLSGLMRRNLEDLGIALYLTGSYFGAVYFAVAALLPSLAIHAAALAVAVALALYLLLIIAKADKPSLPFALLLMMPFICLFIGVIWWAMRLLGFWEIN